MAKIKDLATVQFDTLFTLFPIDSERYELTSTLRRIQELRKGAHWMQWGSRDSRVNLAVLDCIATLSISAAALARISYHPEWEHSQITQDRASRCRAQVGREKYRDALTAGTEHETVSELVTTMLDMVIDLLLRDIGVRTLSS